MKWWMTWVSWVWLVCLVLHGHCSVLYVIRIHRMYLTHVICWKNSEGIDWGDVLQVVSIRAHRGFFVYQWSYGEDPPLIVWWLHDLK